MQITLMILLLTQELFSFYLYIYVLNNKCNVLKSITIFESSTQSVGTVSPNGVKTTIKV